MCSLAIASYFNAWSNMGISRVASTMTGRPPQAKWVLNRRRLPRPTLPIRKTVLVEIAFISHTHPRIELMFNYGGDITRGNGSPSERLTQRYSGVQVLTLSGPLAQS